MLKVKSFSIEDDAGVNELLSKCPLAAGAHVFVSDGKIMVPYEDGLPETPEVLIARIGEQKNTMLAEKAIIVHSQKVLDFLMADANERVRAKKAVFDKATSNKAAEKEFKDAEQALEELNKQYRMNAHEIVRLDMNCELYDRQSEEYRATK